MTTPGFKPLHRSFLTLCHSVAYCLFAGIELARGGWTPSQRTTPLRHYLAVAVFCFLSVFLANHSLSYIDYSTRVMFKCAKPIPTMILSSLLLGSGHRYSFLEFFAAALLGVGLAMGIIGDGSETTAAAAVAATAASTRAAGFAHHVQGVLSTGAFAGGVLALSAILSDVFVSTYEQAYIFHEYSPRPAELILYTYAFAAAGGLCFFLLSEEPALVLSFVSREPDILAKMFASEIFGYASISCVVRLVETFGATNAELVKTVRKGVTVALSFVVLEGKEPHAPHYRGALLFFLGTGLSIYAKERRRGTDLAKSPSLPTINR